MNDIVPWLREAALALAAVWLIWEITGHGRRAVPIAAAVLLLALLCWRGVQIGFVPLTNKLESFLGFSTALLAVGGVRYRALGRPGRSLLALAACGFLAATLFFDPALTYPSPLLVTAWYPMHVPLSFLGYALWLAAAGDGLDYALGASTGAAFRRRQEWDVRWGLVLFSLSMVFGAVWGVVSWGAYFLWDAKVLWSLVSWVFFATFAHVRYWPMPAGRGRVALGVVGVAVVLVTYVGTSFMTGSIHSF